MCKVSTDWIYKKYPSRGYARLLHDALVNLYCCEAAAGEDLTGAIIQEHRKLFKEGVCELVAIDGV